MVTVLVTRPRIASEKLAQRLRGQGFDSIIESLLTMEPLAGAPPASAEAKLQLRAGRPDFDNIQAVMITSVNALHALESGEYEVENLLDLPCFCVGPRTGEGARNFGFRDVRSASGDGTELAGVIVGALSDKGRPVLHIAAQDVDSKAGDELVRKGHTVVSWPVYVAVPASHLRDETIDMLKKQKLDAILVFSVRTAQVLKGLLSQNKLEACCESLSAIGLSEAVAVVLRPLPWRKLIAAPVPTEDAVIECLKQLYPVS